MLYTAKAGFRLYSRRCKIAAGLGIAAKLLISKQFPKTHVGWGKLETYLKRWG